LRRESTRYPRCRTRIGSIFGTRKSRDFPSTLSQRTGSKRGAWWGRAGGILCSSTARPNAAKVFLNWLLSREGQIAFQKLVESGRNSLRIDIPKDDVPEHARIVPGAKYILLDDSAFSDLETVRRFVTDVWKKRS
jgi:ABC-type glycerol-3-phosphate transport system substrate-binding protein